MADLFAVISKAVYEKAAPGLGVGDVFAIKSYDSNPKPFAALKEGGRLYIVTARPGDALWLVGVLENPTLSGGRWVAAANRTPITDLTALIPKLRFASGNGIRAKPGQLGMSLQTPRALAPDDVSLIRQLTGGPGKRSTGGGDLELALQAGQDDAFRVHADALIEKGDPRGELIHLQDKRKRAPAAAVLKKHAAALLGPLAKLAKSKHEVTWRLGYWDSLSLDPAPPSLVRDVLAHPSAKYLRALELQCTFENAPACVLYLARTRLPTLRELTLRTHYMEFGEDGEPEGTTHASYPTEWGDHEHEAGDALWSAVPGLEKLTLFGYHLFHSLTLQRLKELVIEEGWPVCNDGPRWRVPKLEKLSWAVACDDTGTGTDLTIDLLSPLNTLEAPALRHVDLHGCVGLGYLDVEELGLDDTDDVEPCGFMLRRQRGFKKLAKQLDTLMLPGQKLTTKKQIAAWLAG